MGRTDVIIIGAGLSGLSAARKLHEARKTVVVLEARDRVGGKTLSIKSKSDGNIELGEAWINERIQRNVTALTREVGNPFYEQIIDGTAVSYDSKTGQRDVSKDGDEETPEGPLGDAIAKMSQLADSVDLDDISRTPDAEALDAISFFTWCREQGMEAEVVRLYVEPIITAILGCGTREVSFLCLLHYLKCAAVALNTKKGGQYQRTRNGNQSMSTYLASLLPKGSVKLSHPVDKVTRTADSVVVHTDNGSSFTADVAILAAPPPLYQKVRFDPPLPTLQRQAIERSFIGYYAKCVLVYDRPWWYEDGGYTGLAALPNGYVGSVFDTSDGIYANGLDNRGMVPRQYSLTCFLIASSGRKWSALSKDERRAGAIREVREVFENKAADNPVEVHEMEWVHEEWSRGAPAAIYPPGQFLALQAAQGQPDDRLFFAGTDNSPSWRGYMEGAIIAGHNAAAQAIAWLDKGKGAK